MKKIGTVVLALVAVAVMLSSNGAVAACNNGMLLPLTANIGAKTVQGGETTVTVIGADVAEFHHYAHDGDKVIPASGKGSYKFNAYHGLGFNFTFSHGECSSNKPYTLLTPGMVSEARATGKPVYFLKDGTVGIDCARPDGSCAMVVNN